MLEPIFAAGREVWFMATLLVLFGAVFAATRCFAAGLPVRRACILRCCVLEVLPAWPFFVVLTAIFCDEEVVLVDFVGAVFVVDLAEPA